MSIRPTDSIRRFITSHLDVVVILLMVASFVGAAVYDRNVGTASTGTTNSSTNYIYNSVPLYIGPEPMTAAATSKAEWVAPVRAYVTGVNGWCRAKNGTVSTLTYTVKKNGTAILTSSPSIVACDSVPVAGTTSPSPYSFAAGDKATVDIDAFTGGGNVYGCFIQLDWRAWVNTETQ